MLDKAIQFFKWAKGVYEGSKVLQTITTIVNIATLAIGVKGYMQARQMMAKGQDILANKTAAGGKIPVVYGTRRVGAQVVYMDVSNNDSRHVFLVYALSIGECEEVLGRTIELDGNPLTDTARFRYGCYIGSDKISSGSGSLNTVTQVGSTISAGAGGFGTNPAARYRITFNIHHGAASQTADPMLVASMPNWTTSHRLDGICYIAAHYKFDKEGMFAGIPQMTVQVRGKKVYDPRDSGQTFGTPSTYEYSDNPALCFLDYITNNEYGKGLTESQINMTTFSSAANVCDTQVDQPYFNGTAQSLTWSANAGDDFFTISGTLANTQWYQNKIGELLDLFDGNGNGVLDEVEIKEIQRSEFFDSNEEFLIFINGTFSSTYSTQTGTSLLKVKRFTCNGYLDTNKNVMDNAKELLANMRGIFLYINGKYELSIEDTGTSTFSITDNHIISDAGISVDYGNKDKKANKVIVEFFNANKKYELDTATVLHDATPEYYSDDNDEILEIKAEFPYITDPYIAYNMGKAILTRSRNQTTMQFLGTPEMYKLNVGDIVDLTYAGLGFSGKVCRVEALELQSNGLVAVSLIEYFDVYTWEVPPQEPVEELANLPSAYAVKAPTGLSFTDSDSSSTGRPFLSWNEPTDFPDYQYRVNVVDSSSNQVLNRIVDVENCDLNFLPVDSNYVASVTSLNVLGSESDATTLTFSIGDAPTATADIKNDAITTVKILDNNVTDAKINSLTANKLTAGTIDASVITVTNLDADNITSGTLDADRIGANSIEAGKLNVSTLDAISANMGSITAGSMNIGSGNFTVSSSGVMTATGATISGALTATSLNVTGATVTGTLDASTITLNGDPLDDLFGVAGSGSAKTLSIGHDTKNQLKVDGTQMIYTAYDSLQSDGDDALIMNHGTATFYPATQSAGWHTTTIYAGDTGTAGGILTDRITVDATATGLNSSYQFYVNGDAFFDDPITLDTVSAPATTTNKLYNVGGTLYFNGSAVGGGGGGDITSVVAGTNLNGGGTSGDVTVNLDTNLSGLGTISSGTIDSSGTSNFDNFRLTDSSVMGFGTVKAGATIVHTASVDEGIFWHTTSDYGIYRTAGAWTSPNYSQLKIKWNTGIELDGYGTSYGKSGVNILNGNLKIDGTTIVDASRNLQNIPSINNTATVTVNNSGAGATLTVNRVSGNPNIKGGTDDSGYLIMDSSGGNAALNWYSSDRVVLAQGGGNVSIGINSGTDKLNVAGSIGIGGTTVIDSSSNLTNIGTISSGAITANGGGTQHVFISSSDAPLITQSTDDTTGITFTDNNATKYLFYRGATNHFYFNDGSLGVGITSVGSGQSLNVNGGIGISSTTVIDSSRNGVFERLRADGGNLIMGDEAYSVSGAYVGMKTSLMTGSSDYMIISGTSDPATYVSAKDGAAVNIRGGGNNSSNQIAVPDGTTITATTSDFRVTGNVTAYASDARLKTNIQTIKNPIEKIKKIRGVEFDWIDSIENFNPKHKHETGVIAQEIEEVIPDAVSPAPFNEEYKTVDKEKIIALLIESIKDQQKQIDELKARLDNDS